MNKQKIDVKICGAVYTIVTDEDEEHIKNIAKQVDEKMGEILRGAVTLSSHQAAVLAAMNLADECHKAKEIAENMRSQLGDYIAIANKLEQENEALKKKAKKK